jgi:hypothetical protein
MTYPKLEMDPDSDAARELAELGVKVFIHGEFHGLVADEKARTATAWSAAAEPRASWPTG